MRHTFGLLCAALCALLVAPLTVAQTRDLSGVEGRVLDQSGAAVSGARVVIENTSTGVVRSILSGSDGWYAFSGLPLTGDYKLTAGKSGFADAIREHVRLRAGEIARLDVTLAVAGAASDVTVYGTSEGIRAESAAISTSMSLAEIDQTPVLGRKLTSLPLLDSAVRPARGTGDLFLNNTLFVINGSGRRQTTYSIDNSTGDDSWGRQTLFTTLPFSAVQEFAVLTNAESAEYGRGTGGAVNIVTKSGTNNFHADLLAAWRPGSIQARMPLATSDTQDKLWQGSGTFSGPLRRDRTYFLVSTEYTRQKRDSVITSALAPGIFTGEFRQSLALARLDHRLSERHSLMARVNLDRFQDSNPSDTVGGTNLPSTARTFNRRTYSAQLSETAVIGHNWVNEARVQYQLGSPITRFVPVQPSTQFVRPGVATEGESRSASLLNRQYEWADTLSFVRGRHEVKTGFDAIYSRSGGYGQEFGGGFVLGQFRVSNAASTRPLDQLTIADMASFTQSFGNQAYRVDETLWSLFVQDSWRVSPRLWLNLGARYEQQTFANDSNNIAPRAGFSYMLPGGKPAVLRGSYGVYHSELRANLDAQFSLNGPAGVFTFTASPGQLGFPTSLAPLPAFPAGVVSPPRDITVRPGERAFLSQFFDVSRLRSYPDRFLNPYTQQWTLGAERELAPSWIVAIDYVGQHTTKIERPVDLNAPAPLVRTAAGQTRSSAVADATRPITPVPNGFRRIVGIVNQGAAYYNALQVRLRKRFAQRFSLMATYTWSHTLNTVEPDTPQQDPNDSNFVGRPELATSLLDQRHRATLTGWYSLPWRLTVGAWTSLASGRPFNITTGVDNNGDGSFADRPVINGQVIARNAGRGTAIYDTSLFAEKGLRITERAGLQLRGEAFNVFNHGNIVGRNGVYGNGATPAAGFGAPLGGISNVDPGRQFQFQLRLNF